MRQYIDIAESAMRRWLDSVTLLSEEIIDVDAHLHVYVDPNAHQLARVLLAARRGLRLIDIDGDNFAVGDADHFCHDDIVHVVADSGLDYRPRLHSRVFLLQAQDAADGSYPLSPHVRVRVVLSDKRGSPTEEDVAFYRLPVEFRRLLRSQKTAIGSPRENSTAGP